MLNLEPNLMMSRFTFMKTLIAKVLLEGNGYAKIYRDRSGNPTSLELINAPVTVIRTTDNALIYRITRGEEKSDVVDGSDMIHILNFSYDGLIGISTLTHAIGATSLADAADKQAKGFFKGGANLSGILSIAGKVDKTKADALKAAWKQAFDTDDGSPGGIAVLEAGMDFKPVTVNPKDAQMLESRQFSVIEICRFFGVSPQKAFDMSAATYNNVNQPNYLF